MVNLAVLASVLRMTTKKGNKTEEKSALPRENTGYTYVLMLPGQQWLK